MASFILDGREYAYVRPVPGLVDVTRSGVLGKYPKVMASVPLDPTGTVDVYGLAERWNPSHVLVRWLDDDDRPHTAWVPAGNIRRVTDSEWDVHEYHRCPQHLRGIRWGSRLPGFLPA